jgi:hypothetical protein
MFPFFEYVNLRRIQAKLDPGVICILNIEAEDFPTICSTAHEQASGEWFQSPRIFPLPNLELVFVYPPFPQQYRASRRHPWVRPPDERRDSQTHEYSKENRQESKPRLRHRSANP